MPSWGVLHLQVCTCYQWPCLYASSLAKGYDPLYESSSPLASLDGFSKSHDDGLYVMELVVAATNQNALYKKHMFCRKNGYAPCNDVIFSQSTRGFHFLSFECP
jgi:hypothetical protein